MSERSSRSHWESLADQLGAEPQAFPQRPQQRKPQQPPKKRPPKPRTPTPEPPKAADWGDIASELGLAPPARKTAPAKPEPAAAEAVSEAVEERDTSDLEAEQEEIRADVESAIEEPDVEEPDVEEAEEPEAEAPESEVVETEGTTAGTEEPASAEAGDEQPPTKKRRRRKRRRGGSRDKEAAEGDVEAEASAAGGDESEADAAAAEESAGRRKKRRRRGRKPSRPEHGEPSVGDDGQADSPLEDVKAELDAADDDLDEEPEATERPAASGRASHRSIPSWEEAVGVIVSANLESRAKRPSGSRGRGRRRRD